MIGGGSKPQFKDSPVICQHTYPTQTYPTSMFGRLYLKCGADWKEAIEAGVPPSNLVPQQATGISANLESKSGDSMCLITGFP